MATKDELIGELARQVIDMIPVKWSEIYFFGEVEKDRTSWSADFYFKDTRSKKFVLSHDIPETYNVSEPIYDSLLEELYELLLKIYDDSELNQSADAWDRMTMHIEENLKFKINFEYNTLSGNAGPMERQTIWAYETFGLTPPKGTYSDKMLQEYLARIEKPRPKFKFWKRR